MTTIQYKRNFLKVVEIYEKWNHEKARALGADIIINTQLLPSPQVGPLVEKHKNHSFQFKIPTFIIDLSQTEQEIYNNIHKKVKQKIKKSLKTDEFIYSANDNPTDEQIVNFSLLYNSFAKEKKIDKCLVEKLVALRNNHSLLLTEITDHDNNILCSHCLMLDSNSSQASGLYSVTTRFSKITSNDKSLIGRANKCLHWEEMKTIKQKGLKWYNMGGIVYGKVGEGINNFKLQLGATRGYDLKIYHSNSLKGKLCEILLYYKWKRYLSMEKQEQLSPLGHQPSAR